MQPLSSSRPTMRCRILAAQPPCSSGLRLPRFAEGFLQIFPIGHSRVNVSSLAQMWTNPVSGLENDLQTACCLSDNIHILNQSEKHFHSNWKDLVLSSCYVLEVGLKLVVHRGFFFWNSEWAWNGFDFLLVLFSIVESPGFAEMF